MVASLVVEVISEERRFMLILPSVPKEAMNIWGVGEGGRGRMDKDKDTGAFPILNKFVEVRLEVLKYVLILTLNLLPDYSHPNVEDPSPQIDPHHS